MLEHYEIVELEEKWKKYKENKKKIKFEKFKNFKFDKTVFSLLMLVSISIGAFSWLIFSNKNVDVIEIASVDSNTSGIVNLSVEKPAVETILADNSSDSLKDTKNTQSRGSLTFNTIGINSSVDAGGFMINNTYQPEQKVVPNFYGNLAENNKNFNSIPKDDIIDFGNPPAPPKSVLQIRNNQEKVPSGKVLIQTSPLKIGKANLEEKFYSTNDITYSLKLSESAYEKKDYNEAIKWALISNELDKDNIQSWILFAKATYKKGNKQDALIALENFDARISNAEVKAVIRQIKNGDL